MRLLIVRLLLLPERDAAQSVPQPRDAVACSPADGLSIVLALRAARRAKVGAGVTTSSVERLLGYLDDVASEAMMLLLYVRAEKR